MEHIRIITLTVNKIPRIIVFSFRESFILDLLKNSTIFPTVHHDRGCPTCIRSINKNNSVKDREFFLKKLLGVVRDDYDFIFVDCPPSLSLLTLNAMAAADSVLVPIQCEYYALEGVTALMNTINRVKHTFNPHLEIEGILLTMLDGRTNLGLQVVDQVKKHFRKQVFATMIPRNVRLGEAPSHGEPICLYDPRSTGAMAYEALAKEVLARNKKKK